MVQRKRKLTDRIPQPVGMKANIEANMSGKDNANFVHQKFVTRKCKIFDEKICTLIKVNKYKLNH